MTALAASIRVFTISYRSPRQRWLDTGNSLVLNKLLSSAARFTTLCNAQLESDDQAQRLQLHQRILGS